MYVRGTKSHPVAHAPLLTCVYAKHNIAVEKAAKVGAAAAAVVVAAAVAVAVEMRKVFRSVAKSLLVK